MQPNNPLQPQQPTTPQPGQPFPTEPPAQRPTGQIKSPVLESPILSPTHFDPQARPANVPIGGVKPEAVQAHKPSAITIILGAVAIIAIIVSIISIASYASTNKQLEKTTSELKTKNAIIEKVANDTGLAITTVEDVPEYAPVSGYIYISEWGIKIKIPSEIHQLSYTIDQKYRPEICFNGLEASVTNIFPAFADIDRNPGGMGCLMRVANAEGNSNDAGYSFGELVYSYNDYNYFYRAPEKVFSTDEAEQGLEQTAVQIIKNMLVNNISNYQ